VVDGAWAALLGLDLVGALGTKTARLGLVLVGEVAVAIVGAFLGLVLVGAAAALGGLNFFDLGFSEVDDAVLLADAAFAPSVCACCETQYSQEYSYYLCKNAYKQVITSACFILLPDLARCAFFFFPLSGFFPQPDLLCPVLPQIPQLIIRPTLLIFFPFGASPSSLLLSFFLDLSGILTYPGACGLGFEDTGQFSSPSTSCKAMLINLVEGFSGVAFINELVNFSTTLVDGSNCMHAWYAN
jgi:hypothetical protein